MESYKNFKRFTGPSMFGTEKLDIPENTLFTTNNDGLIIYTKPDPKPDESPTVALCAITSQSAFDLFVPLLDGESDEDWNARATLYFNIKEKINKTPEDVRDACLDELWHDEVANKYRVINDESDKESFFINYFDLHHAAFSDLESIWNKIKDIH